jgi:peptidoglycan/xylan/chitin deacetylase (PgdA/CDA1 family)
MQSKREIKKIIKSFLYFCLFYSGCFDILSKFFAKKGQQHPFIILLYHRLVDDRSKYLSKGPVVHHHIKHFKNELRYLKKNFEILSMDEAVQRMKLGLGFKRPSVAITFDDGYQDNYTLAYPVLKKHGVSATIYLTTSLIGTMARTWPDQIELALLKTKKDYFCFPSLFGDELNWITTEAQKKKANIKVAEALKLKPDMEREKLMQEFFEVLEVDGAHRKNQGPRMMLNWNEVKNMAQNGITFGAHSHTHPILSRMPPEKAKEDIFYSKKVIEENLGTKVQHFAFPNGRDQDFSEELRDYCREIGFESVASVNYGLNDSKISAMRLKRIGATSPVWMMAGDLTREVARWYRKHGR